MKILLTGASGFVGSAVMRRLTRERLEVKVLIRESSNKLNLDGHGKSWSFLILDLQIDIDLHTMEIEG